MPIDHKVREPRLGGSEIAAIPPFRCHSYLDEFALWLRKKGNLPREESSDEMRLGKHLEQGIVSYAAELERWDDYVWCDTTSKSEQYPFMVYTPDALIPAKRWGIDAKLVSWHQAHKWGRTVDQIPDGAVIQAWWYMAALDYEGWYVVALVMGENRPRIYRVPRNARAEAIMLRKAEEWWRRYLLGDERPPVTASDLTDTWLRQNHPRERNKNDVARANEDEIDLLDDYAVVRREFTQIDAERKDLEARLKLAIGDRAGLQWPGGKFTWKVTKDSIVTDWEPLANVLLERHPAGEKLLEEYTYTKPGVRRIYFKDARGEEVEL